MDRVKSIVRNVFSNWAGFAINIIIAFFMSPFIVHTLGNVYYGLWVIMMQLSGYLGILELGVRSSVVKYVAQYYAEEDNNAINRLVSLVITIYSTVAIVSLIVSIIIGVLFASIFNFPEYSIKTAKIVIIIIGLNVGVGFIFNVFYGILMGIQRYDIYNKILIVFTLLKTAAIIVFLMYDCGIIALGIIQLVFSLMANITIVYCCKRKLPDLKIQLLYFDRTLFRKVFSYSFISFFINVSQKIIFQTDTFVIGIFLNAVQITFYAIPVTLVEYLRRMVIAMTETLVPLASELEAKKERKNIVGVLYNGTKVSLVIGLPISIVFFFNGGEFIRLWMGEEFAINGRLVLKILAFTHLLSLSHLTSREILFGMALHKFNAICYGCEAIANLVISILLVKKYGIVGVAIGTAIPHIAVVVFVFPIMITRILEIKKRTFLQKSIIKPFLASIPFLGYCFYMDKNYQIGSLIEFFIIIACGMPIYLISTYFICLSRQERNKITNLIGMKFAKAQK